MASAVRKHYPFRLKKLLAESSVATLRGLGKISGAMGQRPLRKHQTPIESSFHCSAPSRGPVFSRTQLRKSDFLRRHYGDATGVLEQADRPGIVTHHELRGLHVDGVDAARRSRGARRRQADSHHVIVERVKRGAGRARGVRVRQRPSVQGAAAQDAHRAHKSREQRGRGGVDRWGRGGERGGWAQGQPGSAPDASATRGADVHLQQVRAARHEDGQPGGVQKGHPFRSVPEPRLRGVAQDRR